MPDISPSSALTSLPSLPSGDLSSPVVDSFVRSKRPSREHHDGGSDTDDSDLTEPLSNLSAQEDDEEDDDLSEPDESVLSPPRAPRIQPLARSSPPPPKKAAVGPAKKKRQDDDHSDSPLSDFDESAAAHAERRRKESPAKPRRRTARVYTSSSSSEDEGGGRVGASTATEPKGDVPAIASTSRSAASSRAAASTPTVAAPVTRPKSKIEVKVVTKTVSVPVEPSPKALDRSDTLPSTRKKRPASETPGTLASLKIRKLKDKKSTPRIQDDSDEGDAEGPGPRMDSTTPPVAAAPSGRATEAAGQANETIASSPNAQHDVKMAEDVSSELQLSHPPSPRLPL